MLPLLGNLKWIYYLFYFPLQIHLWIDPAYISNTTTGKRECFARGGQEALELGGDQPSVLLPTRSFTAAAGDSPIESFTSQVRKH